MQRTTMIVVGASAGGVEALQVVAAGFPSNLQAAVFMVLHIGKGLNGQSELPQILARAGPLRAMHPRDGQEIEFGTIYVAPADRHLLIAAGHIYLSPGPKENRTRPAINPLFRSAAENYRERVTGVILTGLLDDGVAGLGQIKRRGGIAVVQTPESAAHPSMPVNAIRHVPVDHVLPLEEIAALCVRLTNMEHDATTISRLHSSLSKGLLPPTLSPTHSRTDSAPMPSVTSLIRAKV